ncbi:MAG TPA: rRNA maturation RNase YbeY [Candidatus Paceibacterota bacterium]
MTQNINRKAIFGVIKDAVLGKKYELSLSFINARQIEKLNCIYRGIKKPTDILSFPLSKKEGEMCICLSTTRKEAKKFNRTYENFLKFLFIHGLVHLKGYEHGSTMESIEAKFRKRFNV